MELLLDKTEENEGLFLEMPPADCPADLLAKAKKVLTHQKFLQSSPPIYLKGRIKAGRRNEWFLEIFVNWQEISENLSQTFPSFTQITCWEMIGCFDIYLKIVAHIVGNLEGKIKRRKKWDLMRRRNFFYILFIENGGKPEDWQTSKL